MKKLTLPQLDDRLIYLAAAAFVPSIPLFYQYNQNPLIWVVFNYIFIIGGVLAVISLAIYLALSKFMLGYRRAMIIIALFWAAFWLYIPIGGIIPGSDVSDIFYLLLSIGIIGYFLNGIEISRLVANTISILLCLLFAYNFIPGALPISTGELRRAYSKLTGKLPYEIKTEFKVDANLPKPNVYWLHMDGMVGFDVIERYFNDPQTTLKNNLTARGFVINEGARLEGGFTDAGVMALTSPVFYDSYFAGEFTRAGQLKGGLRRSCFYKSMIRKGFSMEDILPQSEIVKAFRDAGYINIANTWMLLSKNLDMWLINDSASVYTVDLNIFYETHQTNMLYVAFNNLLNTSVLSASAIKPKIFEMIERKRPIISTQPVPALQETDKLDTVTLGYVRNIKYVLSIQSPHFVYFINDTTHVNFSAGIGYVFFFDENGNWKDRWNDPYDIQLYLPQHKWAIKQMMAIVDTIIENDQNAVIIIQADHGVSMVGTKPSYFDSKILYAQGYSIEDQSNIVFGTISAVRIPPQYGKLSQPLEPVDIARYLVNNFVGKGNYDYLYYTEE
jgi:hypothetical protein